jgi:hypothetical protein
MPILIAAIWLVWLLSAAADALMKPPDLVQAILFGGGILAMLIGCVYLNLNAFRFIASESLRTVCGAVFGTVLAIIAGVFGIGSAYRLASLMRGY